MADLGKTWRFGRPWLAAGLTLALGVPAWGAKPEKADGTKPALPSPKDVAEAREILKDLQEFLAAAKKDAETPAPKSSGTTNILKTLGRPERQVRKTSLDPAALDALVDKGLTEAKTIPAKGMGDEEFVRRVYFDVAGKLPTAEQVVVFVRSKDKDKRAKLIDSLLAGGDFAENLARYWRDVVRYRATNENLNLVRFPELEKWLAEQFRKNRPWDEIATDLITATGDNAENGATVLQVAHMAQPVEVAGEVSRIFMGVQIQCAQCHDHPTDPWKREQFHQFAAFFAGARARRTMNAKAAKAAGTQPSIEVTFAKAARYSMPDLKDPQKSTPVEPKFFLSEGDASLPKNLNADDRHTLVASYITGQDNPWFAKAFVNRVWFALLGEAFYTPIDDMGPARTAVAPEVLDTLAGAWQESGYDIRWLYRTVLNTRAYQREFRPSTTAAGKTPFAANCPTRLRADQVYDALNQALDRPFDGPVGKGGKPRGPLAAVVERKRAPQDPKSRPGFNNLFGVDPSTPVDEILGTIPQALFLMNDKDINRAVQAGGKGTVLGDILASSPNPRAALEALYLKVLARRPTPKEVEVCDRYLQSVGNPKEALEDILWSLVNSTEFLSRR